MSELEEKLKAMEGFKDQYLHIDPLLLLLAALRKAIEQRNIWMGEFEGGEHFSWRSNDDSELLAILKNEK